MQTPFEFDLPPYLQQCQDAVDTRLEYWLIEQPSISQNLAEAMRYATFNGGKRVRPILVFAAAEALGANKNQAVDAACALEMVHAYSLVHDDLPAMDNDDLRRGKPTCHIAFDEATAILAGDSLQCFAFEVLTESDLPAMTDNIKLAMIRTLAKASGTIGMAGGQALDLASEGKQLTLEELETVHRHKTGCLIRASVAMGGMIAQGNEQQMHALDEYADAIGLAFQVQDDILDIISDTETLGKQQGADIALNKATYPNILGLDAAKLLAQDLNHKAQNALTSFDEKALPLRALANYIVSRSH
ncbi:geranyl transferase [Gammaproteobacteria bacterium 42_54_T18]|nr:geranyl transferase [Gammaproteobacteria bacterium 42_54_T18]